LHHQAREEILRARSTFRVAATLIVSALWAASPGLLPLDQTRFSRIVEENKGKVVMFDFWATWCDPCRAELPELVKIEQKLRARGLVLVTVSADEPGQEAAALKFLETNGVRMPAYIKHVNNDEAFINSIDRQWSGALPAVLIYDRQGRRSASFFGEAAVSDIE
jgi:thiol-disulfide isomerase/thioredoxin